MRRFAALSTLPALLLLSLAGSSSPALAGDANGEFRVYGSGTRQCTEIIDAEPAVLANVDIWMSGFVSMYNALTLETWDVMAAVPGEEWVRRMQEACRTAPDRLLAEIALDLIQKNVESRAKVAPAR